MLGNGEGSRVVHMKLRVGGTYHGAHRPMWCILSNGTTAPGSNLIHSWNRCNQTILEPSYDGLTDTQTSVIRLVMADADISV